MIDLCIDRFNNRFMQSSVHIQLYISYMSRYGYGTCFDVHAFNHVTYMDDVVDDIIDSFMYRC